MAKEKRIVTTLEVLSDMAQSISKSEYGPQIVFRGAFTLISILTDKNLHGGDLRKTTDLDLDWKDNNDWRRFCDELPELLTKGSACGFTYKYAERNNPFNDRGLKLWLTCGDGERDITVSIDLSVRETLDCVELNSPVSGFEPYLAGSIYEILADKLNVFSTQRLGGRIKDFYDISLISRIDGLSKAKVLGMWNALGYTLGPAIFGMTPANFPRMRKPFEMLAAERFGYATFDDTLTRVFDFVTDIYTEIVGGRTFGDTWDAGKQVWL